MPSQNGLNSSTNNTSKTITVRIVYLPEYDQIFNFHDSITVREALQQSGILEKYALALKTIETGIFSKRVLEDHPLQHLDRLEIYRKLLISPMERRAKRAAQKRQQQNLPPMGA